MRGFNQYWNYFWGKRVPAQGASPIYGTRAPTVELASLNRHILVCFCNEPLNMEALEQEWFQVVWCTTSTVEKYAGIFVTVFQSGLRYMKFCNTRNAFPAVMSNTERNSRAVTEILFVSHRTSCMVLYVPCWLFCLADVFMACTINFSNSEMSLWGSWISIWKMLISFNNLNI